MTSRSRWVPWPPSFTLSLSHSLRHARRMDQESMMMGSQLQHSGGSGGARILG
jgi:hypothetical protein